MNRVADSCVRKPLVSPSELDSLDQVRPRASVQAKLVPFSPSSITAMKSIVTWARGFLACPHAHLGRDGHVCPFVASSIKKGSFWLTTYDGTSLPAEEVKVVVASYLDVFKSLEPTSPPEDVFKTILIVLPDLLEGEIPALVDALQKDLKSVFVNEGIMIGQFHPNCMERGVQNTDFLPLRAPLPMLVLRHMAPGDLVFLLESREHFLAYTRKFGREHVPPNLLDKYHAASSRFGVVVGVHV